MIKNASLELAVAYSATRINSTSPNTPTRRVTPTIAIALSAIFKPALAIPLFRAFLAFTLKRLMRLISGMAIQNEVSIGPNFGTVNNIKSGLTSSAIAEASIDPNMKCSLLSTFINSIKTRCSEIINVITTTKGVS